jgi:Cna protein B-type domain.
VISENNPEKPQVWRVLLDEEFEAKLKIVKKDDETKKSVLVPNTEFKVYDLDNKKYVEQVTTYPSTTVHKSYFTDENGYLILPQNLACGNYRIEEVTAPGWIHPQCQYRGNQGRQRYRIPGRSGQR